MKITKEELKKYYSVEEFHDGIARIRKEKDGKWQFVNLTGTLSEEFASASQYCEGFACVKKDAGGDWQLRNADGELSKESFTSFYEAWDVDPEILTYIPVDKQANYDIYNLSSKEIYDNLDKIQKDLKSEYQRMLETCSTKEQIVVIKEMFIERADFIKDMAYQEYKRQKELERQE